MSIRTQHTHQKFTGGLKYQYVCAACSKESDLVIQAADDGVPKLPEGWAVATVSIRGVKSQGPLEKTVEALHKSGLPKDVIAAQIQMAKLQATIQGYATPTRTFDAVLCPACQTGPVFDVISQQIAPDPQIPTEPIGVPVDNLTDPVVWDPGNDPSDW